MKTKLLAILFFSLFLILSLRIIIIDLNNSMPGHNWDWTFPALKPLFNRLNVISKFVWSGFNLGEISNLNISHLIPNSFLTLLSFELAPKLVVLFVLGLIFMIGFFSFKKMLDYLWEKTPVNYLPAFLYAFSPFLFNEIIGGSWYMWVSYAFTPIFFLNLLEYLETRKKSHLFLFLLSSIFVISSLQNFVLLEVLIIFYLVFEVFWFGRDLKKILPAYLLAHLLLFLFNFYWLLPFSYSWVDFTKIISSPTFIGQFESVKNSTQNLLSIFSLVGYLDRNMYYYAIPNFLTPIFVFIVFYFWVLFLIQLIIGKIGKDIFKKCFFWLMSLVLFAFFIKGGNPPFSKLTMWIYEHVFLMRLYRSPQHLMFMAAFIVPILLAFSINSFYQKTKQKKLVIGLFSFLILIWLSGWWYNGDLGHQTLMGQKKDYVDFYKLPPELEEIYKRNLLDSEDNRILFLPASFSPDFLKTEYQNLAQGSQPEYLYLKNPTFVSESNLFASKIENFFCDGIKLDNYLNYLSLFSVRDVILRKDIYPHFGENTECWLHDEAQKILDSADKFEKFLEGKYAVGYQIKADYFLPHFYIPRKIIYANTDIGSLPNIVSFGDLEARLGVYLEPRVPDINTDEVFIEGKSRYVENLIFSMTKGESLENDVPFPYVRHRPISFFYPLVLKKEQYEEWKLKKDPERLINKKLFYASKRISELDKFSDGQMNGLMDYSLKSYEKKMNEALEEIERLKNLELKEKMAIKIRAYWEKHREKIEEILYRDREKYNLQEKTGYIKAPTNWGEVFERLNEKISPLEKRFDFRNLGYSLEIPEENNYSLFIKDIDAIKGLRVELNGEKLDSNEFKGREDRWINLGERKLKEGEQSLILHLPEPENLVGNNWQETKIFSQKQNGVSQSIKDWQGNTFYYLSFDYKIEQGGLDFSLSEERVSDQEGEKVIKDKKLFGRVLRNKETRKFETIIKSNSNTLGAKIYFSNIHDLGQLTKVEFKNLEVYRIIQPEIIARTLEPQSQKSEFQIPKITFVKINPTKYRVKIEGAKAPYTLIFSENFHRGWKAYISGQQLATSNQQFGEITANYFDGEVKEGTHKNIFLDRNIFETWSKKSIPEGRHLLVNGYANSWYVIPEDSNGDENYEIIIEFQPQKLLYIGLGISLVTLLSCLIYLVYSFLKKRKRFL